MLLAIGKKLVDDGHDIEVLTSQPSYKSVSSHQTVSTKSIDGLKIKRIRLFKENNRSVLFKLMNMVYFPLRILSYIFFSKKFDVVMSSTAPPVITGFSSALGSKIKGAKFIYHCMDIHPEIGKISGEFKNPLVFKLLTKMDMWSCKNTEKIIVLSQDMKSSLLQRQDSSRTHSDSLLNTDKLQIINNFSLSESDNNQVEVHEKFKKDKNQFRILFAGNIGRFQMLESFIDAMTLLDDIPNLELVFLGEGAAFNHLKEKSKDKLGSRILFFPHQNINTARKIMSEANLGIVSLLPNIYKYALPSKTMTYLAEGCPLLATVEAKSELVEFITNNQLGVTATPGDPESIAQAIRSFIDNSSPGDISKRCKRVANEYFSENIITQEWSELFKNLEGNNNV